MTVFFASANEAHQKKEKAKARELRQSQWWKNQLGRGVCHHCGERFHPSALTMDHLLPIARGGVSSRGNVVPACKPCNTAKGYKTPAEIALEKLSTNSKITPEESES